MRSASLIVARSMLSTTSHGITRNNPSAAMLTSLHGGGGIKVFLGMVNWNHKYVQSFFGSMLRSSVVPLPGEAR
jgi:hypothetical protein